MIALLALVAKYLVANDLVATVLSPIDREHERLSVSSFSQLQYYNFEE